jgi:polyferredoxin
VPRGPHVNQESSLADRLLCCWSCPARALGSAVALIPAGHELGVDVLLMAGMVLMSSADRARG